MQPLINLKSFLAVLLILVVTAALLVAYFRDYSPEVAGHEQSEMRKGAAAATGHDETGAMKPSGDSSAAMGHGNMASSSAGPAPAPQQDREQEPPGAPLYQAGATGFFLDHTQRLTLSSEQQARLNQIKEQALQDQASADRKIQEAEAEIETEVRQVEKLRADQRLAFTRAVDEAAKVLTEEQAKILLGTAATAKPARPAAKPAHPHKP